MSWYDNQPRLELNGLQQERKTINQFFAHRTCLTCGDLSQKLICDLCCQEKSRAYFLLHRQIGEIENWRMVDSQSGNVIILARTDISGDGAHLHHLLRSGRAGLLQSGLLGSLQTADSSRSHETDAHTGEAPGATISLGR